MSVFSDPIGRASREEQDWREIRMSNFQRRATYPPEARQRYGDYTSSAATSREMSQYVLASRRINLRGWGRTKRTWGTVIHPPHFFERPSAPTMSAEDMDKHVSIGNGGWVGCFGS